MHFQLETCYTSLELDIHAFKFKIQHNLSLPLGKLFPLTKPHVQNL